MRTDLSTYRHIVAENNGHNNAINGNSFTEDYTVNENKNGVKKRSPSLPFATLC